MLLPGQGYREHVINSAVRKFKLLNIHIIHQKAAERIATLEALFRLIPYILAANYCLNII